MLLVPTWNRFHWKYSNWGAPDSTPGVSVTPGASGAEGAWTQMASSANIAQDVYAFSIAVNSGFVTGNQKDHLLDIGVDPAGGTSYTAIIQNIVCGQSAAIGSAKQFFFPMFVKAGSSVAARVQGSNATAGTVRISMVFYGRPSNPESILVGQYSETIGTITGSAGVSFTPGNGAEGSWTSLGTTTRPLWWFQLGIQVSNGTITAHYGIYDLAVGDGTNKDIIIEDLFLFYGGTTEDHRQTSQNNFLEGYYEVPAGATLYVRGYNSASPPTGYNAVAIGIGG